MRFLCVSRTFPHTHLVWIFFPTWVLTFHLKVVSAECALDNQTHACCATCAMDALFSTTDHVTTVLSFCLEDGCQSKLLVVRSWAMVLHLLCLTNEKQSEVTLFLHFPLSFVHLFRLFHFDGDFQLQRIDLFVLLQADVLLCFLT